MSTIRRKVMLIQCRYIRDSGLCDTYDEHSQVYIRPDGSCWTNLAGGGRTRIYEQFGKRFYVKFETPFNPCAEELLKSVMVFFAIKETGKSEEEILASGLDALVPYMDSDANHEKSI